MEKVVPSTSARERKRATRSSNSRIWVNRLRISQAPARKEHVGERGGGNSCQAATPTPARSRGSRSRLRRVRLLRPFLGRRCAAWIPAGGGAAIDVSVCGGKDLPLGARRLLLLRQKPGPGSGSADAGEVSRSLEGREGARDAFGQQRHLAGRSGIAAETCRGG